MRVSIAVITGLLVAGASARAQETAGAPTAWTFDAAGAFLSEAWDYNLSREVLWGGSLALRRHPGRPWSVGGEVLSLAVKQRGNDAWLVGGGPCVRWIANPRARFALFVDIGLGVSRADRRVPPRGTRVNYIVRTSGGVSHPLHRRAALDISLAWLHLSNASLEGRDKNPDIQAIGVTVGVSRSFSPVTR